MTCRYRTIVDQPAYQIAL